MIKPLLLSWAMLLSGDGPGLEGATTLCSSDDKTYFSCVTDADNRLLSLCGSTDLTKSSSYLHYRFGRVGRLELEYPSEPDGSLHRFRYYHYFRALIDRQGILFDIDDYTYTVYHHYEGEPPSEQTFAGVDISEGPDGPTVREVTCRAAIVMHMIDLEEVVPCDPENALSTCSD